jgi:hypothetical protein
VYKTHPLVSIGYLTKQGEPVGDKTRIIIIGPEEDYYCRYGNTEETSSKGVVGREQRGMDDRSCVWRIKE